jgi:hypothetical protein
MNSWSDEFLSTGMVVVEDALAPDFCEEVIARRFSELGISDSDSSTWPKGWQNLPVTTAYPLEDVAPSAAAALFELVGPKESLSFYNVPDNLIINFPDDPDLWWPPQLQHSAQAHWHKDGDWFRHFLDSPEQGMLGIIFWRDVAENQGPTYVLSDSIALVAELLAAHPEGLDPPIPILDIIDKSQQPMPLTGRQGTVVWAHPFLVHSSSINASDRMRIISNTSVVMRDPIELSGPNVTPLGQSVLNALGVSGLDWRVSGKRERVVSERERRWRATDDAAY